MWQCHNDLIQRAVVVRLSYNYYWPGTVPSGCAVVPYPGGSLWSLAVSVILSSCSIDPGHILLDSTHRWDTRHWPNVQTFQITRQEIEPDYAHKSMELPQDGSCQSPTTGQQGFMVVCFQIWKDSQPVSFL